MRVMGLDFGERTIGVAVSDAMLLTAQGIKTIRRSKKELEELKTILQDYEVDHIVLGYPKNMNGTLGPRAQATEEFAQILKEEFGLPVTLWDERLSTMGAQRSLLEADVSRAKRKQVIDKMAAVFILQGYLDYIRLKNGQNKG
ncbi:RNAse H-fold protein YqgF [Desulfitobacterium dehalogenans ATCC 51507]|uniref:Putative pre-16S rRNA nuclease n=1 Tax=Desulfitobacterium dehalogenans (strain ATCC 51507 / DSM 9161 / JW/IU-DC1) TaxID=756499 RepID=I4ABF3_DESDJ|nr:Holliday junction resolvase RuvX [Desulfitobacterium dehalogenans]AFM01288.1 RNAse H-fold protein YqgF [Desulfitobacterium dehalogenans ATCC 51507]